MKIKKVLETIGSIFTVGANVILGLLSFSGMYVIFPYLRLALASTTLSVSYEYEVYSQNIGGSLNKLFKPLFIKKNISDQLLLKILCRLYPSDDEIYSKRLKPHPFFIEYAEQLTKLHALEGKHFDEAGESQRELLAKHLRQLEKAFALELFQEKDQAEHLIDYDEDLLPWIKKNFPYEYSTLNKKLKKLNHVFFFVKGFTLLTALIMSLGTTYLIGDAISIIPIIAGLTFLTGPFFIIPMSVIAGFAYALLTFNALSDLILSNPFKEHWEKLRKGTLTSKIITTIVAIGLTALAVILTFCTAGTWLTIVKENKPLFAWMIKIPKFITGFLLAVVSGLSALMFNIQNTGESLPLISSLIETVIEKVTHFQETISLFIKLSKDYFTSIPHENTWQLFNPFRLILKLTITPLRIIFFIGHLISIGVTSDRVQGISEMLSALLGIISEGFEDLHYFVPEQKESSDKKLSNEEKQDIFKEHLGGEHSHDHSEDFPTRLLKGAFAPVYLLAAGWDWVFSKLNNDSSKPCLTFREAWLKQHGIKEEPFPEDLKLNPSTSWLKSHVLYCLEHFKQKHAEKDNEAIARLQTIIHNSKEEDIIPTIKLAKYTGFFRSKNTEEYLDNLPDKVNLDSIHQQSCL